MKTIKKTGRYVTKAGQVFDVTNIERRYTIAHDREKMRSVVIEGTLRDYEKQQGFCPHLTVIKTNAVKAQWVKINKDGVCLPVPDSYHYICSEDIFRQYEKMPPEWLDEQKLLASAKSALETYAEDNSEHRLLFFVGNSPLEAWELRDKIGYITDFQVIRTQETVMASSVTFTVATKDGVFNVGNMRRYDKANDEGRKLPADFRTTDTFSSFDARQMTCPRCKQKPGYLCVTPSGKALTRGSYAGGYYSHVIREDRGRLYNWKEPDA